MKRYHNSVTQYLNYRISKVELDLASNPKDGPRYLLFFKFYLFIYFWLRLVFIAAQGLFSSCGEQGLLFVAVHGLLIVVASLVAEHRP